MFRNNWFYNYPLHNVGLKISSYEIGQSDYILETKTAQLYTGNYNIDFLQSPTYLDESVTREGFALWLSAAGGFMGIIIRFS